LREGTPFSRVSGLETTEIPLIENKNRFVFFIKGKKRWDFPKRFHFENIFLFTQELNMLQTRFSIVRVFIFM
jgi:hypothetical protein